MFGVYGRQLVNRMLILGALTGTILSVSANDCSHKYDDSLKATMAARTAGRVDVLVALKPATLPNRGDDVAGRVMAIKRSGDRVLSSLAPGSYEVKRRWSAVAGMLINIDVGMLATLATHAEVLTLGTDMGAGQGHLAESLPLTNFDQVATTFGFSGAGTTIAVLDSGIDTNHVDLQDAIIGEKCFAEGGAACPGGVDSAEDDFGHGTAVSGVITSDGANSPMGGAIDADIYAIKVLDSNNSFSSTAFVVDGLDFVITSGITFDAVNLSLGTFASFSGDCDNAATFTTLLANAVDTLYAMGTLSVVSTGNQGNFSQMQAPACVANALSVGASNDGGNRQFDPFGCGTGVAPADSPSCFTNASTTTDVFAPGAEIITAFSNGGFASWHGTSFSAPTVSACISLLREAEPTLSVVELEMAIETSNATVSVGGNTFPRLDCLAAVESVLGGTDADSDGVTDALDNCIDIANTDQRDTNSDGFGNVCDPDLDNNGIVNFLDVSQFVDDFGTVSSGDADFNGDGFINFLDFALFPDFFLGPPGPSGIAP